MSQAEHIGIKSVDANRPPLIRKDPYIELFFELSALAPREWCDDFNSSLQKHISKPKVRSDEGQFIETWVRRADDIPAHLDLLKEAVNSCNELQAAKALELANTVVSESGEPSVSSEQAHLNAVVAALDFGQEQE